MSKYTKELLQEAVENSVSYAGVLRHLGVKQAGGTQSHITAVIKKHKIDTSHFTGSLWSKGKTLPHLRKKAKNILILSPEGSHRTRHSQLSRAMQESGVKYICALCGIERVWNGMRITLEVDHINGNNLDNRIYNLRFLCPNCHSQQKLTNKPHKYARLGER